MIVPGQSFGKWKSLEEIGHGGNGVVFKAVDFDGVEAALKILKRAKSRHHVQRFRDEIQVLKSIQNSPGVLPILDDHTNYRGSGPTLWYAMPLATPVLESHELLGSIDSVLAFVAEIAATLAKLAEREISHRDIKPQNMFVWQGRAALGDFGLVDFPGKESITTSERRLGPLHYLAPEMLSAPQDADGKLADVYSLAKTLWVLVSDQRWPPPGEMRVGMSSISLRSYVQDGRMSELDLLLEVSTKHEPYDRITMAQFESELKALMTDKSESKRPPDLSRIGAAILAAGLPMERRAAKRNELSGQAYALLLVAAEFLAPLIESLAASGIRCRVENSYRFGEMLFANSGIARGNDYLMTVGCNFGHCRPFPEICWWAEIVCEVYESSKLRMIAGHILHESQKQQPRILWCSASRETIAGSQSAIDSLRVLVDELQEHVSDALEGYHLAIST